MNIANLGNFLGANNLMDDEDYDDEMYLAGDTVVLPESVHFLGTADRRAKYKRKKEALKKMRQSEQLDEYEVAMQA